MFIAAEPLPGVVAQNEDAIVSRGRFLRRERPPDQRLHAEHREEAGRHAEALHARRVAVNRGGRPHQAVSHHVGDGSRTIRDRNEIGHVHRAVSPVGAFAVADLAAGHVFPHAHQARRVRVGQRTHQHAAHDAEDRGVRADAERERQHDDDGEAGLSAQRANRVLQVAARIVDPDKRPFIAVEVE